MREMVMLGVSVVSACVIIRSRMWPDLCVGVLTCCMRLVLESRSENWMVCRSKRLSRWMLKSPVMIKSCGVVAADERKDEN